MLSFPALAVIVTVPTLCAVTTPSSETVAIVGSELSHVIAPVFTPVAVNVVVFSFSTLTLVGVTSNVTFFTVTVVGADLFPASSTALT